MRFPVLAAMPVLLGLAACSAGPETYATMTTGVGFGDYQRYLREREAAPALRNAPFSVPPEPSRVAPILPPATMPAAAPSTIDTVPLRSLPPVTVAAPVTVQTLPQPVVAAPMAAPMATPLPSVGSTAPHTVTASAGFGTTPAFDAGPRVTPGVSDEQDFTAVSARETIESDRERLARQRAQYQVIEVTSVPTGSEHAGPDIVAFALSVNHPPGTAVYRRLNPLRWSRWENACLQFRNQDAAQEAFLTNGGPDRDSDNLDPDGDGYACWWDPTPLRQALARR